MEIRFQRLALTIRLPQWFAIIRDTPTSTHVKISIKVDIGISVKKGNTGLKDMIDDVLSDMTPPRDP